MSCAIVSEEMASLNEKDRSWLSAEISKRVDGALGDSPVIAKKIVEAIEPFKPKGWQKARENILAFGAPVAICGLILASLAIAIGAIYQSTAHVKEETQFRTRTEDRLTGIEASLLVLRVKALASNPVDPANQAEAKSLFAAAKKESIQLPVPVIEQGGQSFIEAAKTDQTAWGVALDFVAYRSDLNIPPKGQAIPWAQSPGKARTEYHLHVVDGKSVPTMGWIDRVPMAQGARAELIDQKLQQNAEIGTARFVMSGGALNLDGMYLRHAVLLDVEVHYSGARTVLEDVAFVNCRFSMDNTPNSRTVGERILSSNQLDLAIP